MSSEIIISEDERRQIVQDGTVFLANGLRAKLAGWKDPFSCGVSSALPGFWACSWETARAVVERENRRFLQSDTLWLTGSAWLGTIPGPDDFQTPEDYQAWQARRGGAR